ncbi:MAG: hypothetical protein UR99_C0033G0001 [Candidatus Moranbacteria bacterium GW2011_GWD2_36_12]|nr:MAG: hypothetical protein UR99_C0033G0001 [Candidatus Moranbacteria bacterium GW2011_GWD2_36_12]KKQ05608.1 MAG: hypothetical protein US16_C0031G0001 [Candidatus Moranbacteria bacterium GW2011_GWE2_36_40]
MQQTFYLDSEEEISSVIDRLNKSMAGDNYFVVPKRALFLQSIVNLKLLKREADKVEKKVFIVTQDEIGSSMAERSGIEVLNNIDEIAFSQEQDDFVEESDDEKNDDYREMPISLVSEDVSKSNRLSGVGSNEFYDSLTGSALQASQKSLVPEKKVDRQIPVSLDVDQKNSFRKKINNSSQDMVRFRADQKQNSQSPERKLDPGKVQSIERMFTASEKGNVSKNLQQAPTGREKRIKKVIFSFVILCLGAFIFTASYLFLPSAKIMIIPNISKEKIDRNFIASVDSTQESSEEKIAARVISIDVDLSLSYEIKSSGSMIGKKSHGTVVIYNEYDSSPQTLVATTRLETEDGKIFRLVKNVIVPGTMNVSGEIKPGAVSADVIADQAGADFNIDQTKFTIPGFKDGPKYDKFYAKSSEPMSGGSSEGESSNGGKISQSDIDNAKQKTEAAIKEKIDKKIKEELSFEEIVLPQAEKITLLKSFANARIGDLVDSFEYTVTASVQVLAFSENDVKNKIQNSLNDSAVSQNVKIDVIKIEYGTSDVDFEKNTLDLRIHAETLTTPIIETESIKNELLGKTDDQLTTILRKYPTIKNASIEFSPSFVTRIPQYSKRVVVEIGSENSENQ